MRVFRSPRRVRALALVLVCSTASPVLAADFLWSPPTGSDSQWLKALNWSGNTAGPPGSTDIAHFAQLPQPADSAIIHADCDPDNSPPATSILNVGGILADGFYSYVNPDEGLDDWRVELARFAFDVNTPNEIVATPFSLDVGGGEGIVRVGRFEEPTIFGGAVVAIPGGLTITGQSFFDGAMRSAAVGFRGVIDVRHGRLTLQDINYDDHDLLSSIGGVVDSEDDLSYIPQRLPNAQLLIDHSHFDSFKTHGLLIGSVGRANATIQNGSFLSNLKELRVGGNSAMDQASHELSTLALTDSHITVGDGLSGGIFIGDKAAPDLINPYNGTLTLTRSSVAPSVIRNNLGEPIGVEPLDIHVGHFGAGKLQVNDASSISAQRLFVGEKQLSFGELRINSSNLDLTFPDGPETADHAGRWSVGARGLGFVVVSGTADAPSTISARSLTAGESQNAYGDVYIDRDTHLTIVDSASVGIGGQGRLTITGRFTGLNVTDQRNVFAPSTATVGVRPTTIASDPLREYNLTVGKVWASAGFLVLGEGAQLNVTDQPVTGADDVDEFGVELWRTTDHRLTIGDDGLGSLIVHADANVRAERLRVGLTPLGVGHVLLDKTMLNGNAANLDYAVPATVSISRGASIGIHGVGTLEVKGPYVPRVGLPGPGNDTVDEFSDFGLLTASLTIGEGAGSDGDVRVMEGGQIRVTGTLPGERDLIVALEGAGKLRISDSLVLDHTGPNTYVRGATGGTVRVLSGVMQVGGADATLHPAAKGTVTVHANGLFEANQLSIGSDVASGDSLTTRAGATALVNLPGGGTDLRTFAGGTVRVGLVEMRGASTLAIESNPVVVAPGETRDGGFHVQQSVNIHGGTLRLGMVDRSSAGTLSGDLNLDGGQLTGCGAINGDLAVNGGTIPIQVNGNARFTEFDAFDVSGVATFVSGSILVSAGSHVGQIGEQYDLFTFASGSRTTSFDVTNTLASQPGTQWVSYLDADSYTLAVAGANGDSNFDGSVNFDDLLTLAQHYGDGGTQSWITGDFNDDQMVDFDDLLTLAQNYGASLLGESTPDQTLFAADWALAQAMAPEPTSTGLIAWAIATCRRRRRCDEVRSTVRC